MSQTVREIKKNLCYFVGLVMSYYSALVGEWRIVISLSVCVSVYLCPRAYVWNRWTVLHAILCADPLWPWLGPPLVALRYVMYFWFYG